MKHTVFIFDRQLNPVKKHSFVATNEIVAKQIKFYAEIESDGIVVLRSDCAYSGASERKTVLIGISA